MTDIPPITEAPLKRRLLSLIYELVVLPLVVILVPGFVFHLLFPAFDRSNLLHRTIEFTYVLSMLYGYFYWCWHRSGQTLPMQAWRIQLVDQHGGMLNLKQISLRFVLVLCSSGVGLFVFMWTFSPAGWKWLKWPALAWTLLPYAWALIDREKRFLHDRLVGSRIQLAPRREITDD